LKKKLGSKQILKHKPEDEVIFYEVTWFGPIESQRKKFARIVKLLKDIGLIHIVRQYNIFACRDWYKVKGAPVIIGIRTETAFNEYVGITCSDRLFLESLLQKVKSKANVYKVSMTLLPEVKAAIILLHIKDPNKFKEALESAKKVI